MTDPQGMANLDPKGTVGKIYAGDHKTLLYTKYINYGPHRKDFYIYESYWSPGDLTVCIMSPCTFI